MSTKFFFLRSPSSRKRDRDRVDSDRDGTTKPADEESEPDDEESLMMKQMMGFSKFDTTKVRRFGTRALCDDPVTIILFEVTKLEVLGFQ